MTWILERVSDVESKYLAYEIIEGARIAHGMSAGLIYIWRSQPLYLVLYRFHRDHAGQQAR